MKDSSLMTHMYWSALHYTVELHLLELHREKTITKKTSGSVLETSCCFFRLRLIGRVMSAKTDAHAEAQHVLRQGPFEDT